jgi:hypothetical protein
MAIRPSFDRLISPGEIITMSDDRDNVHWLIAQRNRSMTFDVGVLDISRTRTYKIAADKHSMIYVDPTAKPDSDGLIRAPVIGFEQAVKKFAA